MEKFKKHQEKELLTMIQHEINKTLVVKRARKINNKEKEREERIEMLKFAKKHKKLTNNDLIQLYNADEDEKGNVLVKMMKKSSSLELKAQEDYKKSVQEIYNNRNMIAAEKQRHLEQKASEKTVRVRKRQSTQLLIFEENKERNKLKLENVLKQNEDKIINIRTVSICLLLNKILYYINV